MDDIGENPQSVFTLELDTVVISNKFHEKKTNNHFNDFVCKQYRYYDKSHITK